MKLCFKYITLYFVMSNLSPSWFFSNSLPILVLIVICHLSTSSESSSFTYLKFFFGNHHPPTIVLPSPGLTEAKVLSWKIREKNQQLITFIFLPWLYSIGQSWNQNKVLYINSIVIINELNDIKTFQLMSYFLHITILNTHCQISYNNTTLNLS